MIKKALLAAAALSSAFMLSGCELIFRNTVDCNERPDVCRQNQLIKRANNTQLSSADIYSIDSGKIAVDVSQSNVYFTANSANYTVSVYRNGSVSATSLFSANRVGNRYLPSNPGALNSWLRANAIGADSVEIDLDGLTFIDGQGANFVALVNLYNGTEVSAGTASWYNGGMGSPGHQIEN